MQNIKLLQLKKTAFSILSITIFNGCILNLCSAANLIDAYAQALLYDPTLQIAKATYNKEILALPQAQASLMPAINSGASGTATYYNLNTPNALGPYNNSYNLTLLNLNQTLINFSTFSQLSFAQKSVKAATVKYSVAEQELIVRVTKKYLAILKAETGLNAASSKRKAYAKTLEQAKSKYSAGIAKNTDVLDAQADHDTSISQEFLKQDELENAYAELREIIGDQTFTIDALKDDMPLINPNPLDEDTWANTALQNNLSIQYKKYNLEAAKKGIDTANGIYLPTLSASANIGYTQHTDATKAYGSYDGFTSVGSLTLNIPIYTPNAGTQNKAALADYTIAQKELDKQYRAVNRSTRQAYKGILTAISRVNALKTAIISAESARKANSAAFDLGKITIAELLTQEANLATVKQKYLEAKYDYIANIIELEQATNTLNVATIEKISSWFNE